jgi:hypothetical protein
MKIALRCEKCGNIFMNSEDDLCLELDFKDKKIRYICRNEKCGHENVFCFETWQNESKHSPLPKISIM